jgi:hypothetical protein
MSLDLAHLQLFEQDRPPLQPSNNSNQKSRFVRYDLPVANLLDHITTREKKTNIEHEIIVWTAATY